MNDEAEKVFSFEVCEEDRNKRLDLFLHSRATALSRSRVQALIKTGRVKVNAASSKASHKLRAGDKILLAIPPVKAPSLEPEEIAFKIVHEDASLIVLDKPPGLVVHPAAGHATGTLVHGLLHHCRDLSGIGGTMRPGIVHRLDKDTSGLMVAAKNDRAHASLANQFQSGLVQKRYLALAHGIIEPQSGTVDLPIARHPTRRKQMSVVPAGGKQALTLWERIENYLNEFSLLSIYIKTGRTHQIRVHLAYMGHPIVGDPVYGYGRRWWQKHSLFKTDRRFRVQRQMLHAQFLGFLHPQRDRWVEFEAPLPADMAGLVRILKDADFERLQDKALDN